MSVEELEKRKLALAEMLAESEDEEKDETDVDAEDKEDADDEESDKRDKKDESLDHLGAMMGQAELSEESQAKLKTIFEAAVNFEAEQRLAEAKVALAEESAEAIEKAKQELQEQADGYLSYVVEEWTKKNEVALQSQIKTDIMESFISGLRNLFLEHDINIPTESVDKIEQLVAKVTELEEDIMSLSKKNAAVSEELDQAKRKISFTEITEGMTELDKEKLTQIAEGAMYTSHEEYVKGLHLIKESYFKQEQKKEVGEDVIVEEVEDKKQPAINSVVAEYASFLGKRKL